MRPSFIFFLVFSLSLISIPSRATKTCDFFVRAAELDELNGNFQSPMQALKSMIKRVPANVTSLRQQLLKADARKYLFRLEGLLRLYVRRDVEDAEKLLGKVKELEDAVGQYGAYVEFLEFSKKLAAPQSAVDDLQSRTEKAQSHLNQLLEKWFLKEDPYFVKFADKMSELDTLKDKRLVKEFRKEVEALLEEEFDLNKLQEGVHEMRRQVRWIPIYAEALGNLFALKPDARIKQSYRKMDLKGKGDNVIEIPEALVVDTSRFIGQIGNIKDAAEPIEYLAQSYVNAGLARSQHQAEEMVKALMRKRGMKVPHTLAEAKKIAKEFYDKEVLERWIEALKGA